MGKQDQLVCTCDRCNRFVAVTTRREGCSYFANPNGWKEWDDRNGTRVLLCQECNKELQAFLKPSKRK